MQFGTMQFNKIYFALYSCNHKTDASGYAEKGYRT